MQADEIHSACRVAGIPELPVASGFLHAIDELGDQPTGDIVDVKPDVRSGRQAVLDCRRGIERVRVILLKGICCRSRPICWLDLRRCQHAEGADIGIAREVSGEVRVDPAGRRGKAVSQGGSTGDEVIVVLAVEGEPVVREVRIVACKQGAGLDVEDIMRGRLADAVGGIVACESLKAVGLVLTLLGYNQERSTLVQIGLILSGTSTFFGIVRITLWGSK